MTAPANMSQFNLPGSPAPQAPVAPAPAPQGPPQPAGLPAMPPVNMNQRIPQGDQNWPQELWGKPVGEALRLYTIMRDDFLRRKREEMEAQRQQLQGQPAAPAQPQASWPPQPQAPGSPQPGWRQPAAPGYAPPQAPAAAFDPAALDQAIERALAKVLPDALRPMHAMSADQAFRTVRQEFPDWSTYHAGIISALTGATEEQLANPEIWRSVYYAVKGRALSQPNGQGQPQFQQPDQQPQGQNGRQPNGAIITPAPNWDFTEPSAPGGAPQLPAYTAEDVLYARRFGMSLQDYLAYKGGAIPAPVVQTSQAPAAPTRFGS